MFVRTNRDSDKRRVEKRNFGFLNNHNFIKNEPREYLNKIQNMSIVVVHNRQSTNIVLSKIADNKTLSTYIVIVFILHSKIDHFICRIMHNHLTEMVQ